MQSKRIVRPFLQCLLAFCGLTFAHVIAEEKKPATDLERLQGSWHAVRIEQNGDSISEPAELKEYKLVITEKQMTFTGIPDTYEVNEKSVPKQLDFGFHPGIYKLNGDTLTFCMSSIGGVEVPRPTKFATVPEEKVQLIEFKRSKPLPIDAPEKNFDKSLKQAIKDGAKLLETKRNGDFLKRFMHPSELKQFDENRLKEIAEGFDSQRAAFLNTFRILPKLQPKTRNSKAGTVAEFELTRIHIADGTDSAIIRFIKVGDNWYLINQDNGEK